MAQLIILTGAIQSGKTTTLQEWLRDKDACGILSPVVNQLRTLLAIREETYIPFQSPEPSSETISVGRFHFYKKAFDRANEILLKEVIADWCIIDEVGPLELQGQGFSPALKKLRNNSSINLLLVVRNSLLEEVQQKFNLHPTRVITAKDLATLTL